VKAPLAFDFDFVAREKEPMQSVSVNVSFHDIPYFNPITRPRKTQGQGWDSK
jgi:hypothetical protein